MLRWNHGLRLSGCLFLLSSLSPFAALSAAPSVSVRAAAMPRAEVEEKKPFVEVAGDIKPEDLRPLLGEPPRADKGGASSCFIQSCLPSFCPGTSPFWPNRYCLMATFPELQWRFCLYATQNAGLALGLVDQRRYPGGPWRRILYKAGMAEVFTPYHSGNPHFYDTQFGSLDPNLQFGWHRAVTPAYLGPSSFLASLSGETQPSVVGECRDSGPAWLCNGGLGNFIRRREEFVVWGLFDTGNYDFITEYGFRNDGTISMRAGATGYNSPAQPDGAHMHDILWRVDMDLNGPAGDTARVALHYEPTSPDGLEAMDVDPLFDNGTEGFFPWEAENFTALLIEDTSTNAEGNRRGYELEAERTGSARHYGSFSGLPELWTQADFWVTRWHANEERTGFSAFWTPPDNYLIPYVSNNESIVNQDLVFWYLASAHHHPTDEDRHQISPGVTDWAITGIHWSGFELKPHDFFDFNILGNPARCDP